MSFQPPPEGPPDISTASGLLPSPARSLPSNVVPEWSPHPSQDALEIVLPQQRAEVQGDADVDITSTRLLLGSLSSFGSEDLCFLDQGSRSGP